MNPKLGLTALALVLSSAVHAQDRPGFLSESLAVEIQADRGELSETRDVSTYTGNVQLTRGPLTMRGDELRIKRDPQSGQIEARLSGTPASATHKNDQFDTPVKASASQIIYTTIIEILELKGSAEISRGEDILNGELVRYHVAEGRIEADGGDQRVRILINPPEPKKP